jgi:hypothetical protein
MSFCACSRFVISLNTSTITSSRATAAVSSFGVTFLSLFANRTSVFSSSWRVAESFTSDSAHAGMAGENCLTAMMAAAGPTAEQSSPLACVATSSSPPLTALHVHRGAAYAVR